MPRLSDSMEEGTVLKWLKAPGDPVRRGEDLVEIETDKATMTFQSDAAGRLEILAQEGDTLPIGTAIARLDGDGDGDGDGGSPAVAAVPAPAAAASGPPGAVQGTPPPVAVPAAPAPEAPPLAAAPPAAPAALQGTPPVVAAPTPASAAAAAAAAFPPVAPAATDASAPARIKASPIARRIAREQGLDLARMTGTGPGGRIVRADVDGFEPTAAAAAPPAPAATPPARPRPRRHRRAGRTRRAPGARRDPPGRPPPPPAAAPAGAAVPAGPRRAAPAPPAPAAEAGATGAKGTVTVQEPTRAQQVVARRMSSSKATIPEFTLSAEIEMDRCVDLRRRLQALGGDRTVPSYNDLVVKACGLALREHPRANGSWRDGRFELYSRVNVGVAVAGDDVLVVPTVFDADARSVEEIAVETAPARPAGPRRGDHAARAGRGDLHRLEPRHVRRPELHRRDQPAPGGDPRRRRGHRPSPRPRRRARRRPRHGRHPGLRPPHPLRRRGRPFPRPRARAARGAARPAALTRPPPPVSRGRGRPRSARCRSSSAPGWGRR